jgi:hypothetical protein
MTERQATPGILRALCLAEPRIATIQSARRLSLRTENSLFGLRSRTALGSRGADIVKAVFPPGSGLAAAEAAVASARLAEPGRGGLFLEGCEMALPDDFALADDFSPAAAAPPPGVARSPLLSGALAGIMCIVQRGQGDALARTILEMGFSAPVAGFGLGMGLRSKLGLLRVTIPAGKETVAFLVSEQDAEEAMALVSDTIGLDLPGRGFIYRFPVEAGIADARIHDEGARFHVASMEQVIAAIDDLSGGAAWRRRFAGSRPRTTNPSRAQADAVLVNLSLTCEAGLAESFIKVAMDEGASGATLSEVMALSFQAGAEGARSPREASDLILSPQCAERALNALEARDFFGFQAKGTAEISAVVSASAYGPKRG